MIYGERIRLRSIEREDLPRFVEWLNDLEVIEGLALYLPFSLAEETKWFEKMIERPPEERSLGIEIRNRVFLRVHAPNRRAISTYEKAGFVQEGRMRQAVYKNGEYQDMLFMSVLLSEWDAQRRTE